MNLVRPSAPTAGAPTAPRSRSTFLILAGAVLLLVAAWVIVTYNQFVRARQAVDAQWAQVESVYQRRADLIPNLVAATQGYLVQERFVFEELTKARAAYAAAAPGSPDRVTAANQLQGAISRLLAIVERYPDLRSSKVVLGLMDELAGTEHRIVVERRRYNEQVRRYNQLVLTFPGSLIATATGFRARPYFHAEADTATPPKVP